MYITAFTDGSAKPNPGMGGFGYVLYVDGSQIIGRGAYIAGRTDVTNNEAEYRAIIAALQHSKIIRAQHRRPENVSLIVYLDSELVVKQVSGEYATNKESLVIMRDRVRKLLEGDWARLEHVLRHRNKLANDLANAAVDRQCEVALNTSIEPTISDVAPKRKHARK